MFLIDHVSKAYGSNPVLINATLEVVEGQLSVISGRNGTGKTTLLKIAATLLSPDSGSVIMLDQNGVQFSDQKRLRQRLSYLSHSTFLYDDLTVCENLRLFSNLMQIESEQPIWINLLERFGITNYLDTKVKELSHGTKKKVSLCRNLMKPCTIMLWDEPDSGLDDLSIGTLGELAMEQTQQGKSILLTSHNRSFIESIPCIEYELLDGSLIQKV
tara:strand:- start:2074 stop:2718 length:645 start_codon:yes stop_codon:yes gene_type:complete